MIETALALRPDLRERATIHGPEELGDAELLALLIGTGSEGESAFVAAARLLSDVSGLGGIVRLGARELAARRGIGPAKAARILAALELGRRAAARAAGEERRTVSTFDDVVRWAHPRLAALDHEEVWLLSLDGKNGLVGARRIAQGGLHGCALTPRDILRAALSAAASGILLVHNHPSGDPTPSLEDVRMTRLVLEACEVVGFALLDHVVVARGGAASLRDLGVFSPARP